jgi:lambda repressor-like predicted transcriptional regulator
MQPIYKIPGYESFTDYYVTEKGEIYSKKTNKFLKQQYRTGYKRVSLSGKDVRKCFSVHRLVALTFHYFDGCEKLSVNHKDENPLNNHKDNLEWLHIADNIRYSQAKSKTFKDPNAILADWNCSSLSLKQFSDKYGVSLNTMWDTLNKSAQGENLRKRRKFDRTERLLIAKVRAKGMPVKEVAEKFKCSQSMVSKVYREYVRGELNELS